MGPMRRSEGSWERKMEYADACVMQVSVSSQLQTIRRISDPLYANQEEDIRRNKEKCGLFSATFLNKPELCAVFIFLVFHL